MKPQNYPEIVFLADLGTLRAFRLSPKNSEFTEHQGPAVIEELTLPSHEWSSDRPSRFPTGRNVAEAIPMSPGENHQKKINAEKNNLSLLAKEIERVLAQEDTKQWGLAAPATINRRLLEILSSETREVLGTNIKSDLTHINLHELEERFLGKARSS